MPEEINIPTNKIEIDKEFLRKWKSLKKSAEEDENKELISFLDETLDQVTTMADVLTTYVNYVAVAEKTVTSLSQFLQHQFNKWAEEDPELKNLPDDVQQMIQTSLTLLNYMNAYVEKIHLDNTNTPLQ